MKFYTSLSPSPKAVETQRMCTASWAAHGHEIVCVQGPDDDVRGSIPDSAVVVQTKPFITGRPAKPYVTLDSILEAFLLSSDEVCCIINGDIEIVDPDDLISGSARDGSLVCGRRWDHDGIKERAVAFPNGFDFFVLHRYHAETVPRSMFVIGQTFWDYWLPWSCAEAGHQLATIGAPVAYHRRHPMNYGSDDWTRTIHHFLWLTRRPPGSIPIRVSTEIHRYINNKIARQ